MRAPAESMSQKIGVSCASAYSVTRTIFSTVLAPHEPAFTVGSLATTQTARPSIVPTPVTTPSAGRSSPGADAFASSASSMNEPSSSSRSMRSRTNSLCCSSSLSASFARLPVRARSLAARISSPAVMTSVASDGQDGDVVVDRGRREVTRRFDQRLAQHVRGDARVAPQEAGDALLAEELLTVARLGKSVGVGEKQVARVERDLAAVVAGGRVEEQEWTCRPQRLHLTVVPKPS